MSSGRSNHLTSSGPFSMERFTMEKVRVGERGIWSWAKASRQPGEVWTLDGHKPALKWHEQLHAARPSSSGALRDKSLDYAAASGRGEGPQSRHVDGLDRSVGIRTRLSPCKRKKKAQTKPKDSFHHTSSNLPSDRLKTLRTKPPEKHRNAKADLPALPTVPPSSWTLSFLGSPTCIRSQPPPPPPLLLPWKHVSQ